MNLGQLNRINRAQVVDLRHWYHTTQKAGELYIACEDWNFAWTPDELQTVKRGWKEGHHITYIAGEIMRPVREVAVLIMDLAENGKIKARPGGVFGE